MSPQTTFLGNRALRPALLLLAVVFLGSPLAAATAPEQALPASVPAKEQRPAGSDWLSYAAGGAVGGLVLLIGLRGPWVRSPAPSKGKRAAAPEWPDRDGTALPAQLTGARKRMPDELVEEALTTLKVSCPSAAALEEPDPFEEPRPPCKLYSPGGGPLGGIVLLFLNYRRLGKATAASVTLLAGLVGTAALVTLSIYHPVLRGIFSHPWLPYCINLFLYAPGMYGIAKLLQQPIFNRHIGGGGKKASRWAAAGIGLLTGLTVGFIIGFIGGLLSAAGNYTLGPPHGKIEFGPKEEIYFTSAVTEVEAHGLGRTLQEVRYFDGKGAKAVVVSRSGDRLNISFVVRRDSWDDQRVVNWFRGLSQRLSMQVFGGKPVDVRLCDEYLSPKRTITYSPPERRS